MASSSSSSGGKPWMSWQQQMSSSMQQQQQGSASQVTTTPKPPSNLCSLLHIRFLPHPSDANRYFECVGLQFAERACPSKCVWNQTRAMCVKESDEGDSAAGMTTTTPAAMNPCAAAWGRLLLPYPGDPSRFIVCYDSMRYDVYQCSAGLVWVQNQQMCGKEASTTTTTPTTTVTTSTNSDDGMSSLCWTSFYHAYPPDSTRFLQCDSSGHVFVLHCGPRKIWNDGYKTCVDDNGMSSTSSMQQQGQAPSQ